MNINLCNILILSMLADDDEPLNLILAEAMVTENNREFIKQKFWEEIISELEIKNSLKDLIFDKMIILLNEYGETSDYKDLNEIFGGGGPKAAATARRTSGSKHIRSAPTVAAGAASITSCPMWFSVSCFTRPSSRTPIKNEKTGKGRGRP